MGAVGIGYLGGEMGRLHTPRGFRAFWYFGVTVLWLGSCLDVGYRNPTGSVARVRCGGWGSGTCAIVN